MADFKLTSNFDLIKTSAGDYEIETGYNTTLYMSLYSNRRADETERGDPGSRGGWWGNEFQDDITVENGSKLWLIYGARNTEQTLNSGVNYIIDSLLWLKAYDAIDDLTVNGKISSTEAILFAISLFRNNVEILSKLEFLWEDTK